MAADLDEKTGRYGRLLAEALSVAEPASGREEEAAECLEMARSYLEDGGHFREAGDPVNALAAFSYGHGWLDAGARLGVLDVPTGSELFTN
ncbi:DUF357 domain-containing protein [Natronorarus salvus]|uniref:DUF357 domain-containing protein n=1 Tax=Natronorarus salvus TaxID=3117733 RepID=UPI002F2675BD